MSKRSLRSSIEAFALVLTLWLAPISIAAAGPEAAAEDVGAIAGEVLTDGAYQTTLPLGEADDGFDPPAGLSALASVLLYVGAFVVLILGVLWVVREFFGDAAGAAEVAGASGGPGAAAADAASLLGEPERLAREGRFEEAIHALLLLAIRHLGRDLPRPPSVSTTSRELARLLPLAGDRRDAFRVLVEQVEISLFGGRQVVAEDYERCRHSLHLLTREAT